MASGFRRNDGSAPKPPEKNRYPGARPVPHWTLQLPGIPTPAGIQTRFLDYGLRRKYRPPAQSKIPPQIAPPSLLTRAELPSILALVRLGKENPVPPEQKGR